jgi:serine/threonine protein kinase
MPLAAGDKLGPYEILAAIGAGGMGEVYRARDTRLDRIVAIKVLPAELADRPELRQRLEREARAVSSLNHPHICTLYDIGRENGRDFLVMEYLEGETLGARLARGPLEFPVLLEYAVQIAEALGAAHRREVFHRDLKPGNITLTKSGVKLLDFGLAKIGIEGRLTDLTAVTLEKSLTAEGTILGTLQYMAPEQLESRPADARTDLFAFGAVLYEMATGKKAFEGRSQASVIAAILERQPPPIATLQPLTPPEFERIVQRCLAKDPEDRWHSARDLATALKWLPEGGARAAAASAAPPQLRRPIGWIAAAAVATLGLLGLSALHFRESPPEPPVVRFSISPPEKGRFSAGLSLSVSPNGRQVAYTATGADGRTMVWVRSLDSREARALPGTEGVNPNPSFWSPDSRFIGFSAGGKLKKIEIAGGPPQTLCDAPGPVVGGAWNREGLIVFGSAGGGGAQGLYKVPAAGGSPVPITEVDASRGERSHNMPVFLPDGRHFLYCAFSAQPENRAVYATALDSKDRKRLITSSGGAAYSPGVDPMKGHLLFLRDATLMAQSFDATKLELTGEAFPVAEQVGSFISAPFFSVSENGVLAWQAGGGQNSRLVWFDREGKSLGPAGPPGKYQDLALSPDGTRVAVSQADQGGNLDVWVLELSREALTRLTFAPGQEWDVVWSPDGSRIAFSRLEGGTNIYAKASSGAGEEERMLPPEPGVQNRPKDWSRDGRYLLYTRGGAERPDLWVLPMTGDRKPFPYLQTQFFESQGQFSPDGKWVAYISEESGRYEVFVQPFPAAGGKWQISTGGGGQPRWRGDGKELFFVSPDGKLMAAEVSAAPTFKAGVPKALFQAHLAGTGAGSRYVFRYAVAADGKRFLMNTQEEQTDSPPITVVLNWLRSVTRPRQ